MNYQVAFADCSKENHRNALVNVERKQMFSEPSQWCVVYVYAHRYQYHGESKEDGRHVIGQCQFAIGECIKKSEQTQ